MQISQFILYHGSDTNVKLPVWNLGSRYRDFGQCFYTTYDRETAEDWADKMNTLYPVINKYALNLKHFQTADLRIKRFAADAEWAEFVYNNRENSRFHRPAYDIIIGPIADRGLALEFKKVKHRKASFAEIAPLIHYDKYNSYQVAFCTDKALQLLTYLDK
jgi:hypothetical protein